MKQEINLQESNRAEAFRMWMSSPMPMVTLVKTFDVTRLVKVSKKSGVKFTALMCWCIGKAASQVEEFYTLPVDGKLYRYDKLAINIIVENSKGGISSCDIPFSDDLQQFNRYYLSLTAQAANECKSSFLDEHMVIGTSAMIQTELDCIVNQSDGDVGQVSHGTVQDYSACIFPIPSCSDGWWPCCKVPSAPTE